MNPDQPELRLSDAERQDALDVLSEHVSTGRLDLDEYADRSAKVTTARTRGDLGELFADLPEPLPEALKASSSTPVMASHGPLDARPPRTVGTWLASSAVPIAAVLGVVLLLTGRGFWWVLVLPALAACLVGVVSVGGQGRYGR